MCKLPLELLNYLRLRILGNEDISGKFRANLKANVRHSLVPSLRSKNKNFAIVHEN